MSVFDYGTLPEGAAFLVMEFVSGRSLRQALREEGRMTPEEAIPLMAAIAEPVDAAHRTGILHRDLTPENILLPDAGVTIKVLDFGIAKAVVTTEGDEEEETADGGGPANRDTRLHGAGAAGRRHVDAAHRRVRAGCHRLRAADRGAAVRPGSMLEVATRQQRGLAELPSPPEGIPPGVSETILAALSMQPDARPASAGAFAGALARVWA